MCLYDVRPSVCLSVCMIRLGEQLPGCAQLFLEVVGEVLESVSLLANNYFLNTRNYFLRRNVAHVVFRSIIYN